MPKISTGFSVRLVVSPSSYQGRDHGVSAAAARRLRSSNQGNLR